MSRLWTRLDWTLFDGIYCFKIINNYYFILVNLRIVVFIVVSLVNRKINEDFIHSRTYCQYLVTSFFDTIKTLNKNKLIFYFHQYHQPIILSINPNQIPNLVNSVTDSLAVCTETAQSFNRRTKITFYTLISDMDENNV